ncbi:MAG: YqgE/AlgH family protein, partial [Rhodobacterales bacterium]|nr:YqgE/AlgH family protein [Rhodobacterales bacterium]
MTESEETLSLTGKMLIAMPGMGDPRFDKSVVFICAHSDEGTMGLIINKPTDDVRFAELLEQLEIDITGGVPETTVHIGGPVENGRGFVLHSPDYTSPISTLKVDGRFSMTATLDILEEIAQGGGPKRSFMALGYAGWGPGQLAGEIVQNGWLTCDADPDLVFGT